jgi:hypothetical protein
MIEVDAKWYLSTRWENKLLDQQDIELICDHIQELNNQIKKLKQELKSVETTETTVTGFLEVHSPEKSVQLRELIVLEDLNLSTKCNDIPRQSS